MACSVSFHLGLPFPPNCNRSETGPIVFSLFCCHSYPWWLLVTFGSYSLWSLGWGLFTFRDCPEAYTELLSEINDAKNALRSQGVTVD
ncbi:dolichol-phosphate mannosyltransferase subunit 3-domain-containing protein [Coprinopsis sp. MPI-PUGE-AT-0042]|nr:dolichol-phosphate mannosyltransferase subunit 3-domain-containing protein [Coprinopsis sp. MPI-PUGE-AT-0042]